MRRRLLWFTFEREAKWLVRPRSTGSGSARDCDSEHSEALVSLSFDAYIPSVVESQGRGGFHVMSASN
jgi:hypothetical protein